MEHVIDYTFLWLTDFKLHVYMYISNTYSVYCVAITKTDPLSLHKLFEYFTPTSYGWMPLSLSATCLFGEGMSLLMW